MLFYLSKQNQNLQTKDNKINNCNIFGYVSLLTCFQKKRREEEQTIIKENRSKTTRQCLNEEYRNLR
jgi:hypothetical protein